MAIKKKTADQALDELMLGEWQDLYESCYAAYKDFYNTRGFHLFGYSYSELANWWVSHFYWNQNHQRWDNKIPE